MLLGPCQQDVRHVAAVLSKDLCNAHSNLNAVFEMLLCCRDGETFALGSDPQHLHFEQLWRDCSESESAQHSAAVKVSSSMRSRCAFAHCLLALW